MVHRTFWLYILDKERFREGRNIPKDRAIFNFLNIHQLERQGADIQSKIEELEELKESLRERDKMKDDAIAHLSDQLIAITSRLDSMGKRQQ